MTEIKKRCFIALLLTALLLSGCACEHEWTETDCLNPQVCIKCQETGAEAPGHDWTAASCQSPETCSRCGETQGASLGHDFGDWNFGETDMTHACSLCGVEETADLDRGLYLESLLPGFWDGACLFHGEDVYSSYDFSLPLDALCFGENRSVSGHINGEAVTGTWEFVEYKDDDDSQDYIFSVDTGNAFKWAMLLSVQEDENLLYIFYPNGDQTLLSDNDALADSIVSAGSWGGEGTSGMYSLTFHADRTVTGTLDQDFQGTWQLMHQEELGGLENVMTDTRYCGVYIRYVLNSEEVILQATISPSRANMFDTRTEEFTPGQLTLRYNNSRFTLEPMSSEDISAHQRAMQEGPNQLLGTWSSLFWRRIRSGSKTDTHLPGYSITFRNDNTFTAYVDRELTGTWSYQDDLSNASDPESGSYFYYLQFDNDRYVYRAELYYQDDQMPELRFWGKTSDPDLKILFLGRMSESDNRVLGRLIGDWTSMSEDIRHPNADESTRVYTMDYHFTFHEDGTFTGYDGTDLRGTWNLARIFYNEDNSRTYYFDLYVGGPDMPYSLVIYDHGDEMYVDFRENRSEINRTIRIEPFSQEVLDAAAIAPTIPIGEWISSYVTHYADEGGTTENIDTSDYSFIVSDDGTFTAQLDTSIRGTWGFKEYQPDSGYYFWFDYPGMSQYGPHYFFVGKDEDFLTFRLFNDDLESFYYMVRS